MFHTLYAGNLNFKIGQVDLVTDRNNIHKLLRFVRGSSGDAFQIRVEVALNGRTVLLTRVEARATETTRGFRGYGQAFEKAYTQVERGSSAHYKTVGYDFGGMRCIVRHECDGYVDDNNNNSSRTGLTYGLSEALKGLTIPKPNKAGTSSAATTIESGGRAMDSSSTLVINTLALSHKPNTVKIYYQLWASQTHKLVTTYNRDSVFDNIQLQDIAGIVYK